MAIISRTDGGQGKAPQRIMLTGATGMVGEGVLHECLKYPQVEQVLVIGRNPCGLSHPKLTEIIAGNLYDLAAYEGQLQGYNACFYCLGTTSSCAGSCRAMRSVWRKSGKPCFMLPQRLPEGYAGQRGYGVCCI